MTEKNRHDQVLDAAVRVLGRRGPRALTHRAVDAEAGLPHGFTSNLYSTREALLKAILRRLSEVEAAAFAKLAAQAESGPMDADDFATYLCELMRHLLGPARKETLARRALFTEAVWSAELQREVINWSVPYWDGTTRWLRQLGSPDPERDGRLLFVVMEALLFDQLVRPDPSVELEDAIEVCLRGMLP